MSPVTRRSKALPLIVLATGIVVSLSGCIMPPALPTAPPQVPSASPQPTATADPVETTTAPTPPPSADGALPELVAIGTELPPGTVGGWETSIITDDAFELQPETDFPIGPTISVVETATGCSVWAYQGAQDSESTDEGENSEVTLGILSDSSPDEWEADIFTLDASSQGSSVEMLSIFEEAEDGSVQAWYARNFQSGSMTSSIRAECPAGAGGLEHVDAVVGEHFQINFLVP